MWVAVDNMSLPPALESEFELVEELPTGKVFQCYHVKDMRKGGADAVVRLLPENFAVDQSIVNRFHEFFARLNDIPNRRYIPSVYSVVGVPGKHVYVVEDYCAGVSLPQFVNSDRESKTFIQDVTDVLARVCEALHHSHQKSIYHLCVLPSDILIDEHDYSKVKLVGFGAQIFVEKGKIDYLSSASSRYVAPEVFKRGVFGPKADVYSLAVMIKELLPEFSQGSDLLDKALSTTLKDRFSSARQFAANIKELSITDPATEPAPKVTQPTSPKGGLHLVLKIKTDPESAEIWSNGQALGITSASGLMVAWKPETVLEIKKTGYSTETLDLSTPPDNADINVKLQSSLILYTNPWGATVRINGVVVGVTDRDGLAVPWKGYAIEIQKVGYKPETIKFGAPPELPDRCLELQPVSFRHTAKRHWLELVGYVLGAIVLWLLPLVIYSATVNRSGLEKDIGDKDIEIARLTQAEKALRIDFDKQASDFRSQVKTKDAEIERLAQSEKSFTIDFQKQLGDLRSQVKTKDTEIVRISEAEKNLKIDVEKQVVGLRSDLNRKDAEITKLTQLDQEKTKLQSELQKQLNDLKSTVLIKDKDITRLSQVERENQQLQAQLKSLKQSQSQPPQAPIPPVLTGNHSLNTKLIEATISGNNFEVSRLLTQGVDANARNGNSDTALMLASVNGHYEVVKALLKSGANKNVKNHFGQTALDYAKRYNYSNIVSLLSENVSAQTPPSPTLTKSNHSLNMQLIAAALTGNNNMAIALLHRGAYPNAQNSKGHTALMLGATKGHLEAVKTLLKHGADKNLKSPSGQTALDYAKLYNHTSLFDYLR
jgi:ankyrin repeat protein